MRFYLSTIVATIVLAFSINVYAIALGPLSGQMKNHTNFKNTDFEVEVLFQCAKPGQDFDYDKSTVIQTGRVNTDGAFTVPELKLPSIDIPSYLNCRADVHYKLRDELEKKYAGPSNLRVMLFGKDFYDNALILEFTAIELAETPVSYTVSSGISSEEFVTDFGKNYILSLTYDFSKKFPYANEDFRRQLFYRWGNYFRNSVAVTTKGIVYLPGLQVTKNIEAQVYVRLRSDLSYDLDEKNFSTNLSSQVPAEYLKLNIDYSKLFRPLTPITGVFKNSYIYIPVVNPSPRRFYQSYNDTVVTLACKDGVLTGEMNPGSPSAPEEADSTKIVNMNYNITGTCDDKESGEGYLELQFLDYSSKKVSFSFDRLASCFTAIQGCLMSSQSPETDTGNHPGAEYSTSLELKDAKGQSIGIIQIGTGS